MQAILHCHNWHRPRCAPNRQPAMSRIAVVSGVLELDTQATDSAVPGWPHLFPHEGAREHSSRRGRPRFVRLGAPPPGFVEHLLCAPLAMARNSHATGNREPGGVDR